MDVMVQKIDPKNYFLNTNSRVKYPSEVINQVDQALSHTNQC
jgi:hypothetical protein